MSYRDGSGSDLQSFRLVLYGILLFFSIILLGLTAGRISNTERRAFSFYEPTVVELLVASILMILSCFIFGWAILSHREGRRSSVFYFECFMLTVLWFMLLVGAAVASSRFPSVNHCSGFSQCRLVQAILAFSWISWIIVFILLIMAIVFAVKMSEWDDDSDMNRGRRKEGVTTTTTGGSQTGQIGQPGQGQGQMHQGPPGMGHQSPGYQGPETRTAGGGITMPQPQHQV